MNDHRESLKKSSSSPVSYLIDERNLILSVNQHWDQFARQNQGEQVLSDLVIGQPLFHYISGDPTRMYVRVLFDYVRRLQKTVIRDYRCDSDTEKRYMQMIIHPREASQLLLEHRLLATEKLDPPLRFAAGTECAAHVRWRCSTCNSVEVNGHWMEPDKAYQYGFLNRYTSRVAYRICPECQYKKD